MGDYSEKLINMFYTLRSKDQRSKQVYYFFAILYRCSYLTRDNNIFFNQILKIIQNNFKDEELLR